MMKIAFNAVRVSKKAGSGFDTFIINFINEFAKYVYSKPELNIDFDVYTFYPHHFSEVKKENIKLIKLPFLKQKINDELQQHRAKKNFKKFLTPIHHLMSAVYFTVADYFRMFWTQLIFPFYTKKYNFVVAMTQLDASFICVNQIIVIHDMIPFIFSYYKYKHKFFLYRIFPNIALRSKMIFAVSESTKKDIVRFLNIKESKINVIYEGSRFSLHKSISETEKQKIKNNLNVENFILYVGSYHPRKNLINVIKALSYVRQRYVENLHLIVVGYIPKKEIRNINLLLQSLSLQKYVKLLGYVSDEEIKQLFLTAEVFVFPTLYEGFGLPPLEAMACGCPVVVSNCGSLPEVCGDAAVYVNPYDPKDIADGILKVLTDKNLRQQLIKKGFEQVKKFTWESSVTKFIEALKNLQNNSIE